MNTQVIYVWKLIGDKPCFLTRVRRSPDINEMRVWFMVSLIFQLKYCPLTWVFYSGTTNNRIDQLYDRALRFSLQWLWFVFWWVVKKNQLFFGHHYNIQIQAIEINKVYNNLSRNTFSGLLSPRKCKWKRF